MYDFISGVLLESGNKEDTVVIPLPEEVKVAVCPVHSDDAAGGKGEMAGGDDIGSLAFGDDGEVRQIAVVVKEQMELDSTLGLTEIGPGEEAETEIYDGSIETEELVLEAELLLFAGALAMAQVPESKKGILIELPGPVGISVGERALRGGGTQSQMTELTTGDRQSVTDLSQALGLGELAEKHGDTLVPRGKALGVALCPAFADEAQKGNPWHDLKNLGEQTCGILHDRDSFKVFGGALFSLYYFEESLCFYSV